MAADNLLPKHKYDNVYWLGMVNISSVFQKFTTTIFKKNIITFQCVHKTFKQYVFRRLLLCNILTRYDFDVPSTCKRTNSNFPQLGCDVRNRHLHMEAQQICNLYRKIKSSQIIPFGQIYSENISYKNQHQFCPALSL